MYLECISYVHCKEKMHLVSKNLAGFVLANKVQMQKSDRLFTVY